MMRHSHEPARCVCMSDADGLSTHRAAKHLSSCHHSTLRATTKKFQRLRWRPIPGTRAITVSLDGGR
jgi:hypothetical protein